MTYRAPVSDIAFALKHTSGLKEALAEGLYGEMDEDTIDAVLEEAGKFASDVIAPLNRVGDTFGTPFKDGKVTTPPGFKEAYWQYVNSGWGNILSPAKFGGQELPHLVATPVEEMWGSANLAFKLCPMLTQGAIEAIAHVGPDTIREKFLPNMISGKWTGTMNLT